MKNSAKTLVLSTLCAALLSACGGGGDSTAPVAASTAPQMASLTTYITDNLATDYSKVWVGISDITLVNATGAKTVIFSSATPTIFNIASLAGVSQMLASASIPVDTYTKALITVADKVQLDSLDGSTTTNAVIKGDGTPSVIYVDVDVDTKATSQLVLDFDLAKFTYDAASNRIVPVVVKSTKKGDSEADFERVKAEVHGNVVSVDAAGLTITDKHLGPNVRVLVSADTQIVIGDASKTVALKDIVVGSRIEAQGPVVAGAATPTLTAKTLEVNLSDPKKDDSRESTTGVVKGEGRILSISGKIVTVRPDNASFLPGKDKLALDFTNATFAHGTAADMVVGGHLGFKGTLTKDGVAVTIADVGGAPSKSEREADPKLTFREVHGTVVGINNAIVKIDLAPTSGSSTTATQSAYIDLSHAEFTRGRLSCVVVGGPLEAAGIVMNDVILAKEAFLDRGCPTTTSGK